MICGIVHTSPSALLFELSHPRSSRESQRFPAEGLVHLTIPDLEKFTRSQVQWVPPGPFVCRSETAIEQAVNRQVHTVDSVRWGQALPCARLSGSSGSIRLRQDFQMMAVRSEEIKTATVIARIDFVGAPMAGIGPKWQLFALHPFENGVKRIVAHQKRVMLGAYRIDVVKIEGHPVV
jgi:hypothetical protein